MTFSLFRTQHFIEFAYFYLKNMNTIELRDDIDFQLPTEYFYWTSFNKININSLFMVISLNLLFSVILLNLRVKRTSISIVFK